MLTAQHCDVFNRPFFQFSQLKQYAPDTIPQLKTDYKIAWEDWKSVINQVYTQLIEINPQFQPPHIERWCNGWQVRAHFFAYFKYAIYNQSAAILSILLNRKRLTVSLDWHCYKANVSAISLPDYNQWLDNLDVARYADFDVWHDNENEYSDYLKLNQQNNLILQSSDDFFCIGKHIDRDHLAQTNCVNWIGETVLALTPLYEKCFAHLPTNSNEIAP
ncbi:glucose-6-phosphate 1-dehydrogenase family protein [Simonsiella muelleri]|uniref:Glucose-6-phosphate 1-dehydrogenase n=1 Tax=Simonsiella muelleri ATCC 29453 TaxID=641147 RepID=V9HMT3_9NEIS|nr:HI_0552 family protein [Simonsiella muelleri]AUX60759.1 diadenosine tetraphosphatase [Simonsiella muelleri ATCC 29453]EFG31676.1 hypothetical protein HMPREF9021_00071 [Simonsiella muelleri ATCC 29453]UBQ54418.1 glucose-6-phosphate 1-dehydrogenase family protein [Simonsiella muelleri]